MSRSKDRERYKAMLRMDPDYKGFRGYMAEPSHGNVPLEPMTCTVCGRTRNIARGIAIEQRDNYVCSSCLEKQGMEAQSAVKDNQV